MTNPWTSRLAAVCGAMALTVAGSAGAADAAQHDHDHEATAATSSAGPKAADPAAVMKDMQVMHQKVMSAKTPAERQALMAEHMKVMQSGMQAMQGMMGSGGKGSGGMGSGGMGMGGDAMKSRMDMMTMMMQMMMDRATMMGPAATPAPATPPAK